MKILPVGVGAALIEVDDLQHMLSVYESLRALAETRPFFGIVDLVPAARTVLVKYDPAIVTTQQVVDALAGMPAADRSALDASSALIKTRYDGDDLPFICDLFGMSREQFVAWHTGLTWQVAFTGFAPGFGYLASPAHTRAVPRLDQPRVRIPAGAVGLAGEFTGIYPRESPGGWRLVGTTDAVLFDLTLNPPAVLAPGRSVRFVEEP